MGNTRRWGINSRAGARALLGCDRSWVLATESSSHPLVPGEREKGRVACTRLSGMLALTSSFLGGRVDALRDGTAEATWGGESVEERSENLFLALLYPPLCLCHGITYRSDVRWALWVAGVLKCSIHSVSAGDWQAEWKEEIK